MGLVSPGLADTDLGVVSNQVHLPVVISTAILYLLVLTRLVSMPARMILAVRSIAVFLPLIGMVILSAAWSTDPSVTLRRAGFLLLTTIIALILGTDFEVTELVRLLAAASFIHILLCAAFFAVAPHTLYSPSDAHALKGLTTHKNIFGFEQGLAFLAFLFVPFQRFTKFRLPLAAAAFVLLLLSHSSGSLVATVSALACIPFLFVLKFSHAQRLPLLLIAATIWICLFYLLLTNASIIPTLLSKDATLTGRTQLWSLVLIAISNHPLLGYGFDSFWQGLQGDSLVIIRGVGWLVPTAHNGYLDLLLSIGYVGASLFCATLSVAAIRAVNYVKSGVMPTSARFFPCAFLVFLLVYNLNESALLTRSGIPFLLFVAMSASLKLHQTVGQSLPVAQGLSKNYRVPVHLASTP
ncbi:O-antigen ligase family protein [Granulicella arctica]|uniref:O-antigen ligase family protein n=1 Tax=Granulicella arctica TaxID=940613 RepID=UPI0021E0A5F0|nr:O-antigen ligase family protein [Granulicella arctica]